MSVAAVAGDAAVASSTPDCLVALFTPRRASSLEEFLPMTMACPRLVSRTNIREWFSGDSPLHPFGGRQHAGGGRRDVDDQEEVLIGAVVAATAGGAAEEEEKDFELEEMKLELEELDGYIHSGEKVYP